MKKYSLKNLDKLLKERLSIPDYYKTNMSIPVYDEKLKIDQEKSQKLPGDSREISLDQEEVEQTKSNINNQVIFSKRLVNIPFFGTFNLNPIQIGIIAFLNEFYFGNKQLLKNTINSLYNQRSQISLAASLDYSLKNINTLTESNKLTADKARKFLDSCKKNQILDSNYNIINESINSEIPAYGMGFLFELFANYSISDKGYTILNKQSHIDLLCNHTSVKYVTSILNVIYLYTTTDSLESYFDDNIKLISERSKLLYNHCFKNTEKFDIDYLIDDKLKSNNISFEFQIEGKAKDNPIDLVVRYENYVVAMLDLKSHLGENNTTVDISTSKGAVNTQINKIMAKQDNPKDFSIGIIRFAYTFINEKINIHQFECIYSNYENSISGHNAMIKRVPQKIDKNITHTEYDEEGNLKEYFGRYKMIVGDYLTANNESNNKPIRSDFSNIKVDFKNKTEKDRKTIVQTFLRKSLTFDPINNPFNHVKKTWWHRLNDKEKKFVLDEIKKEYSVNTEFKKSLIDRYFDLLHFDKNINILDDFCLKLIAYINNDIAVIPITTDRQSVSVLIRSKLYARFNTVKDLKEIKKEIKNNATENTKKENAIKALDKAIKIKQIQKKIKINLNNEEDKSMLGNIFQKYETILKFPPKNKKGMPAGARNTLINLFNSDETNDKKISGYLIDLIEKNNDIYSLFSDYNGPSEVYKVISDKLRSKKSLDKNCFNRGRDKLLREVYQDLFREDQ